MTHDGRVPLMELKVSFFLSDASADGHAATCLVPGSHLWTPQQRATWNPATVPVVPLRVPAGTVLLWRSTLLHSVTPHHSPEWRLHLMFRCDHAEEALLCCASGAGLAVFPFP